MKKHRDVLLTISFLFISFVARAEETFPLEVLSLSSDERLSTTVLVADKTKRKLTVFDKSSLDANQLLQQYDIDIGKNGGPKVSRNDQKTPEGIYLLETKKIQPEIPFEKYGIMAFTTNYPNFFDKFENKTGNGIWLHSVPDTVPLTRGSRGCVVLRNDALKSVEKFITLGKTFLIINDQINWVASKEDYQKEKESALAWMENWKALWQAQDFDKYIENYSDDFVAPGFNKTTWLKHKKDLKERYKFVKLFLSSPQVFHLKNQYLFQFMQEYESDGHKDIGIKSLYVLKEGDKMKIHREEWVEYKQPKSTTSEASASNP
jgi:murein L,D-transpeptidase YafK